MFVLFLFGLKILGFFYIFFYGQKWHPDKQKDQDSATSRFQDINEAYQGKFISQFPPAIFWLFDHDFSLILWEFFFLRDLCD